MAAAVADEPLAESPDTRRDATRRPVVAETLGWGLAALAAFAHGAAMLYLAAYSVAFAGFLAALVAPAVVTVIVLPEARKSGWHRWAATWALTLTSAEGFTPLVLLVAETWVLRQFWVVERTTALPGLPGLPRLRRRRRAARAEQADEPEK